MPIYGQIGGGTSYSSGTISSGGRIGTFSGTTTTMPSFGQIGSRPIEITRFKRIVLLDIYRQETSGALTKVYEVKADSTGSCGNINSVISEIIDGMFVGIPGENGKTQKVETLWHGSC
jgi:hypothetical protein